MDDTCDTCHKEIKIGTWPFCPHDPVSANNYCFTPYRDVGLGKYFYTRGDRRQHLKKNHIEPKEKGVGMPGCEY